MTAVSEPLKWQRPKIVLVRNGAQKEVSGEHCRYAWLIRPDISTELDHLCWITSQARG